MTTTRLDVLLLCRLLHPHTCIDVLIDTVVARPFLRALLFTLLVKRPTEPARDLSVFKVNLYSAQSIITLSCARDALKRVF